MVQTPPPLSSPLHTLHVSLAHRGSSLLLCVITAEQIIDETLMFIGDFGHQ